MKIKLADTIKITSGDDKDRTGKVIKINRKTDTVLIDGLNTYKRHLKAQGNQQAGIVTISRPIKASKVMIVCPHCGKTTRPLLSGAGREQVRLCRHCQKPLITEKTNKFKK